MTKQNLLALLARVVDSGILTAENGLPPRRGAYPDEIRTEETLLGISIPSDLRSILTSINGGRLGPIYLWSCGTTAKAGRELASSNALLRTQCAFSGIAFGQSDSGAFYIRKPDGRVVSVDLATRWQEEDVASSLEDFMTRVVFGRDAGSEWGEDWVQALHLHGLV